MRGQPLGAAAVVGELEKGAVLERLGTLRPVHEGQARRRPLRVRRDRRCVKTRAGAPSRSRSSRCSSAFAAAARGAHRRSSPRATPRCTSRALRPTATACSTPSSSSGARKVFYQSNRKASDPKQAAVLARRRASAGHQRITVVARENEDTVTPHRWSCAATARTAKRCRRRSRTRSAKTGSSSAETQSSKPRVGCAGPDRRRGLVQSECFKVRPSRARIRLSACDFTSTSITSPR